MCARCQVVRYCNRDCQKSHWKAHKPDCRPKPDPFQIALKEAAEKHKQNATPTPTSASPTPAAATTTVPKKSKSLPSQKVKVKKDQPLAPITFSLPPNVDCDHPLLTIADIPNKGRGFVAASTIEAGTLLLQESSIYAHSDGCGSNEEQRLATLAALTKVMVQQYPQQLAQLCFHPEHELPEHDTMDIPPIEGMTKDAWHEALTRVDSNQFTSNRGMMCSPSVSMCNHSCYPTADLIIREVPVTAADGTTKSVEQVCIYAIQPIEAGSEVTINYLGSDSLCRWYAPSMIRQESFQSQWQFTCDCIRCQGPKARAIDRTLVYATDGMDEELEERYTQLVLSEDAPEPVKLLQLYRDLFQRFHGEQFFFHYLLHQIRTMLIFMPIAFDERQHGKSYSSSSPSSSSSSSSSAPAHLANGESEWLHLVTHHIQSLASNLLNPPLHSIKSDSLNVIMKSCDFIGHEFAKLNANKEGADIKEHVELRKKVIAVLQDYEDVQHEPAFQKLYPDTYAIIAKYAQPEAQQ